MISKYQHTKWLKSVFIFLYATLAFFIPFNKVGLSISTMLLVLMTILTTSLSGYAHTWKSKKSFKWLVLLFAISLISLSWTNDFTEGLKFINLTLPFYLIFIVFSLKPITSEKDLQKIYLVFIVAVTITTFVNLLTYAQGAESLNYDKRELSKFTSHIRLSLMVVIAIVLSGYLFLKNTSKWKWLYAVLIGYFLYYTYFAEVVSGYISLLLLAFLGLLYAIYSRQKFNHQKLIISSVVLALFVLGSVVLVKRELHPKPQKVLITTAKGNVYWSDTLTTIYDNGYPVNVNIQMEELKDAWRKRSDYDFDTEAKNGVPLKWNLIRYMASKGLNKDSEGVQTLTEQDIKNIENGYVSILQFKNPLVARILMMKDELLSVHANPNGYTFLQRLAYWKAGITIFKENSLIGVGSGGAKKAFQDYYVKTNSALEPEYRKQSHQQFLSIAVNYGLLGLMFFILFLIALFKECRPYFFSYVIVLILLVSFFTEDTLETQVGATLFAFFTGLLSGARTNSQEQ